MSRTPFSSRRPPRRGTYRPQLEALESRLAPGSLLGVEEPPLIDLNREADEVAALAAVAAGHDWVRVRTTGPVVDFADASIVRGSSTLTRTDDQVRIHLKTTGLVPGGAYTVWWAVFEPPGSLPPKVGFATGFVAGRNGKLNLKADLNEGETLERHPTLSGGALQDALQAEIRVVLRFHGPASPDPARLFEQTQTFEPDVPGVVDAQITTHLPPATP